MQDLNVCSRFGPLLNLDILVWFSSSWFAACKNFSLMLSCLYFQALAPDDLGGCGLFCHPSSWVKPPLFPPKHTRIQTKAMTHHSNNSVRDHMKWVSGSLHLQNHHHGFSVSWRQFICLLVPFSQCTLLLPNSFSLRGVQWTRLFCPDTLFVCVARLGCWVVRRCCPAWPWCKPTASQARRRWCQTWARGTEPATRASRATHTITTTDTRFTTVNHTTATWAIPHPGAVLPWWDRYHVQLYAQHRKSTWLLRNSLNNKISVVNIPRKTWSSSNSVKDSKRHKCIWHVTICDYLIPPFNIFKCYLDLNKWFITY